MAKLTDTVKNNKVIVLVAIALLYFIARDTVVPLIGMNVVSRSMPSSSPSFESAGIAADMAMPIGKAASRSYMSPDVAPTIQAERMVVQDTSLSLVVQSVDQALKDIKNIATEQGGYMVDTNQYSPEGAATGHITLRVPAKNRDQALEAIKRTGNKVVSESVHGSDVTDQYADLETRLNQLNATKTKFEAILEDAATIPQILEVTRELQNIQSQIDALKGQQQYLQKTAELTRITVNLSTDELALPYAPETPWSPEAIFKQAVRSLIGTLRGIGSLLIWVGVYLPLILPIIGIVYYFTRRNNAR